MCFCYFILSLRGSTIKTRKNISLQNLFSFSRYSNFRTLKSYVLWHQMRLWDKKHFSSNHSLMKFGLFCDITKGKSELKNLTKRCGHENILLSFFKESFVKSFVTTSSKNPLSRLRVVLDGKFSQEYPVNAVVPQGSILGPTLFLIYINDFSDDVIYDIAIYADDLSILNVIRHLICGNS